MKIAFVGTHSTGKTTLTYECVTLLKKRGIDADALTEVVRDCPLPLNEAASVEAQLWVIFTQLARESHKSTQCKVLVCDRSVLDSYVYYTNKFGREGYIEDFIKQWFKGYKDVYRVAVKEEYLQPDSFRSTDKEFQKAIDERFDEITDYLGLNIRRFVSLDEVVERVVQNA